MGGKSVTTLPPWPRFLVETVTIKELIGLGGPFEKEKVAEQFVTDPDKVCGRLTESQFWDSKLRKKYRAGNILFGKN